MGAFIRISTESVNARAVIVFEENPKTAEAIVKSLPLKGEVSLWGQEIYFPVPVKVELENGRDVVSKGDVAYWPEEPSLCVFFGPTPSSRRLDEIRAYSPVNVIGRVLENPDVFKKVKEGERIVVQRA